VNKLDFRFFPDSDSDPETEEQRINEALRRPSLRTPAERVARLHEIHEQQRPTRPQTPEPNMDPQNPQNQQQADPPQQQQIPQPQQMNFQDLMVLIHQLQTQNNFLLQNQAHQPVQNPNPLPVPVPQNLRPERPPNYEGKSSESLTSWLFLVEQYCTLCPVPIAQRATLAGTFLRAHAALWWQTVIQDIEQNEEHLRWGAFVQAIKEQFEPVHTTKTARSRLDQLKQKTSVRNYNTEFRAIMLQLPAMHEDDRIHAYIKGLKPAVASLVAMQQPGTLLLAQQLADTADTIQFQQLPK
jgi:hypothetical protein